ncbi:hypothetical protein BWD12_02105 [Leptospira santarosai serovar Bananal]|uniref:Uncharacterized protein n=1 Tax=Leptospira santarosai TaxID=28183 RepID=A0AB73MWK2_9LEPT|nr:hypothetical protein BWD11_06350 [Leptospira santarosai serovar Grippotyphosa]ONF81692.1 hypothetical protein BWD12_02105 [Leptospira santarosai serovar Bananal]ONF90959.1 hypothetical protein BWD14_18935 [Leptospira santarosai]
MATELFVFIGSIKGLRFSHKKFMGTSIRSESTERLVEFLQKIVFLTTLEFKENATTNWNIRKT